MRRQDGKRQFGKESKRSVGTTNTPPPSFVLDPNRPLPFLGSRLSVRRSSWWRLEMPNNLSEIRRGGQGMCSSQTALEVWLLRRRVTDTGVHYA